MDEEKGTKQTGQIPDEIASLNDAIDRLGRAVDRSENCLASTLTPPTPEDIAGEEEPPLVPLAEEIRSARNKVIKLCKELELRLERVEL